jgi:CHAD domain
MKARRVKKLDPEGPLVENAARIVRVRLDEMRSFTPAALHRDCATEQHDLRIAAKRLRYVLEATEFCFGRPAETARRRARDIQEVLGELHDCDVMLPRVAGHVGRLRSEDAEAVRERAGDAEDLDPALVAQAPNRTAYRGLEVLAVHVEARRALLFDRFVELWGALERAGTWEKLERSIERKLREARERQAAAERAERAAQELEAAERAEREAADRARLAAEALVEARRAQPPPPASA